MKALTATKPHDRLKDKVNISKVIRLSIAAGGIAVVLIIMQVIKGNTAVSEWITRCISRPIVWVMGHLTYWLPFSLFELLVITAVIALIALLVLGIRRLAHRRFWAALKGLCVVMVVVLSILSFYTVTAGFAYYREEVPLPMSVTVYRDDGVAAIADYFVKDYIDINSRLQRDDNGDVKAPYSRREMINRIRAEFGRLNKDYYFGFSPMPKGIINSWFMSDTGITGIAFLPTGEPNYNRYTPKSFLPQVIAHEIAHTKGVMRENEANLVAYYILLTSEDEYLRYCGYFAILNTMYTATVIGNNYTFEKAQEVFAQIPQEITDEKTRAYDYWDNYSGPIDFLSRIMNKAGEFFNDLYLKINGAKDGTGSYDNPWDIIDTGEVDPETNIPIIEPVYSKIHKIFFAVYEERVS